MKAGNVASKAKASQKPTATRSCRTSQNRESRTALAGKASKVSPKGKRTQQAVVQLVPPYTSSALKSEMYKSQAPKIFSQ